MSELSLRGLDGSNPLAYLAALGLLRTLARAWPDRAVSLAWRSEAGWTPVLRADGELTESVVCETLEQALRHESSTADTKEDRNRAREISKAKRALRNAESEAKKRAKDRKIRGKAARELVAEATVELRAQLEHLEAEHRAALAASVPLPQLALGNDVAVPPLVFREHARRAAAAAKLDERDWADFVAASGIEVGARDGDPSPTTPFRFLSGAGHQHFLKTYADLLPVTNRTHFEKALFALWTYEDSQLSFRWDPVEDRRYALRAGNPSSEPARTMWGANRLAIEAIPLFSSAPGRRGLVTAGWRRGKDGPEWTWAVWEPFLELASVRTLLGSAELTRAAVDREHLRAQGVVEVFRAVRQINGKFVNFTPARPAPASTR